MKELQNKIRNEIATAYKLRDIAKDGRITPKQVAQMYEEAKKHDEKVIFFKNFKRALEEQK